MIRFALAAVAMACALPALRRPEAHRFVLTGSGRFAVFADLSTMQRDGDIATMRSFQVVEPGFTAGGTAYWGGWSRWSFDCKALTADRLDFAAVREGGAEGPVQPGPPATLCRRTGRRRGRTAGHGLRRRGPARPPD
jgi:hypothetical protein